MIIGYARISDSSQNLQTQIDALEKFGCDEIVEEVVSGISKEKELNDVIARMQSGDVLVVARVDRLGRNTQQILALVEELNDRGADLVILDLNIDTRSVGGKMVLSIMAAVSEYERSLNRIKQRNGIESAKRAGKHLGRKASYSKELLDEVVEKFKRNEISYVEAKEKYGIPKTSLYRAIKKS